jgi:membrane-associated protease RseP (regulator of RpoE activity)
MSAPAEAVVRVNATNQSFDFARPWSKKPPFPRRGTGAIIADARVLVTAELIANHTYVEIEKPLGGDKSPAQVLAVDYDANLALLRPVQEDFLEGLGTFGIAEKAKVGEAAEILQVENNGEIARTPATVTTIAVSPYPLESAALLAFRLSSPLQSRDSSFVLPAVRGADLLGLLMRYDARSQTAEVVPGPVIRNFLARAESTPFQGPPRLGFSYAPLRDPGLRAYLGLSEPGGIYLTEVLPGSPAALAGLQTGDVVLSIAGHSLDPDGLYDDPAHGKILFTHLIASRMPEQGPLPIRAFRKGTTLDLSVTPAPRDPARTVSEPYLFDTAPRYVVLGGIIFQELSGAFLREWGGNWRKNAPQRLVFLDAFQTELPPDRGKIVFVSGVLPSDDTLGYEGIENLVVTKLNDRTIRSLDDLALAAKEPLKGFHKLEFETDPKTIYLDARSIEANAPALAEDYGIPTPSNL